MDGNGRVRTCAACMGGDLRGHSVAVRAYTLTNRCYQDVTRRSNTGETVPPTGPDAPGPDAPAP
ncbi:outer membrane chaperone skp [Streptomyces laurentii]|uniref:Outer membrane chaperone skp n=1 Tax=Streptomyces laurentii TaxID=39478 RepID=A0A160NXD0_STRLU|nr:outer membrane chaperone skp [Streptomyces laurentii]